LFFINIQETAYGFMQHNGETATCVSRTTNVRTFPSMITRNRDEMFEKL